MNMQKSQKGFTLIELVVVMVILAIMAAVAIPQFINLRSQARVAALNGLAGALNGAVSITQAKYFALGGGASNNPISLQNGNTVDVSTTIGKNEGAPLATATGIGNALNGTAGLTPTYVAGPPATVTFDFAPTATGCNVTYNSGNATTAPVVTVVNTGGTAC